MGATSTLISSGGSTSAAEHLPTGIGTNSSLPLGRMSIRAEHSEGLRSRHEVSRGSSFSPETPSQTSSFGNEAAFLAAFLVGQSQDKHSSLGWKSPTGSGQRYTRQEKYKLVTTS